MQCGQTKNKIHLQNDFGSDRNPNVTPLNVNGIITYLSTEIQSCLSYFTVLNNSARDQHCDSAGKTADCYAGVSYKARLVPRVFQFQSSSLLKA